MGKKLNVLIVDDAQSMRFVINATLLNLGHYVQEATDGLEALKSAKKNTFDLVITDINMPNMDGFQLIEALRSLHPYKFIPILALTTQSDTTSKQKAKQLGATGWIVKPFTPERLTELVTKLTDANAA